MTDQVTLTIDSREVTVPQGTTIYHAAREAGIEIPTLCFHEFIHANGLCRICVVEVAGSRVLVPACVAKVSPGMQVTSGSPRVRSARKTILEMLAATVDLTDAEQVQVLMEEYEVDTGRFPGAIPREHPILDDNPMYIRDYSKCILCWRCVQVCGSDAQYTFAINLKGRGYHTSIGTFFDRGMQETTCVFCGQCVEACPTGALKSRRQWLLERSGNAQS